MTHAEQDARERPCYLKAHLINGDLIGVRPRMSVTYHGLGIGGRYSLLIKGLSEARLRALIAMIRDEPTTPRGGIAGLTFEPAGDDEMARELSIATDTPSKSGWYWFREREGRSWRMTEVHGDRAYGTWITGSIPARDVVGQWWGPIPTPDETDASPQGWGSGR